jgi:hypothetical protein
MLSTASEVAKAEVVEKMTAEVNALDNLTAAQRELVLGIAVGYARNHGTRVVVVNGERVLVDAPHYQNIANHVRFNPKA